MTRKRPPAQRRQRTSNPLTLYWLALPLWLASFAAQASTPAPYHITGDDSSVRITVYAEYLFDPAGELTLNDVRSRHSERFIPAASSRERLGFHDGIIWMRLALRNDTDTDARRILEIAPGLFRHMTFYSPTAQGYSEQTSGLDNEPPWADIRYRHQLLEVEVPAGEVRTFFMRIKPNLGMNFAIYLSTPAGQIERSLHDEAPFWITGGMIASLMLFNIGLFASSRHRAHLYYSLFQFFFLVASFTSAGLLAVAYLPMPSLHAQLETSAELLAMAASAQFTRHFLQLRGRIPVLAERLRQLAIACVILALLSLSLSPHTAGMLAYGTALTCVGIFFYVGIRALSADLPLARLYLTARTLLLLTVLAAGLASFSLISLDISLPLLMLCAAALEAILFAAGLSMARETALRTDMQAHQHAAMEELTWQTRSDTLSRVSHEIRTPMSGILGMAELLGDTPLTPNQKECVRTIRSSGENLLRIINDVLEYSRLGDSDSHLNRDHFNLSDVVMDAVELFRERAEEKQVELIAHIHTNVPPHVEGDPNKLRQTITSILGTCVRHATTGEIIIDVGRDTSGRTDHLRFEIEGSAIQHAEDFLAPLCADAENDSESSTELALTIAHQLIETMAGQCGLRQGRRHGAVCWFSVPLPAVTDVETNDHDADPVVLAGRSMLVVDDSSTVTRVIRQQALNWGMRVTIAHDPREALASIRTQANLNDPFDIVLLDQHMPGMSGMQLAARIHEDPLITHPMVLVMLTGVQDAPTATQARNVGIHQVLSKPVSGARLKQTLAEALGTLTRLDEGDENALTPDPGLKILVAEDHLLSQKVIRGMLAKLGLDADVVANGREAVAAVRKGSYDVVLMDCEMPEMDGFEATRAIRSWERANGRAPLPVIALTAHILREHRERSLASGMNAHVPKPVELHALAEVLVRFTRPAAGGRGPDSAHASDDRPG